MFVVTYGRAFAGCSHGNDPVGALGDLPIDEGVEAVLVEASVPHRRDQGGDGTLEHVSDPFRRPQEGRNCAEFLTDSADFLLATLVSARNRGKDEAIVKQTFTMAQ